MTVCLLSCTLTGCSTVGPAAIQSGRLAYNEAIIDTDNQQLLMAVIHSRYEERASLLAVASITANVRVVTSAGLQLGFGDDENYTGNLVPFTAGTLYEDNPTISYTPVAGEKYARRLLAPLPVATLAQLSQNLVNPEYIARSA